MGDRGREATRWKGTRFGELTSIQIVVPKNTRIASTLRIDRVASGAFMCCDVYITADALRCSKQQTAKAATLITALAQSISNP
jgi:hypothetical protein